MKMRNVLLTMGLLFAFLTIAYAAGVDGKWVAQIPGRQGNTQETTFNFKASGEKLEGTMTGRQGDVAISDGTVKGNDISFNVVREFNGNKITMKFVGKMSGDEIKFSRTMEGGPGGGAAVEFTAKRAS
ncbi:MAG: hypothetical protein U0Y68_18210 [Blastocatellia bacterium]